MDQKTKYNNESSSQQIQLADMIGVVRKRKWVVIIFFLVVVTIVTIHSFTRIPLYKATSQVLIERPFLSDQDLEKSMIRESRLSEEYYTTQIKLLSNRNLAHDVIGSLELWKDYESIGIDVTGLMASAKTAEGMPVNSGELSGLVGTDAFGEVQKQQISWLMVDWYLSNLYISPVKDSHLINIGFKSTTPNIAFRVANAHAKAFVEKNVQMKYLEYKGSLRWLNSQLDEQKNKVAKSERAIHTYKEKQDTVSFEGQENVVSSKFIELNNLYIQASKETIKKQAAYNQLESFSIDEDIFSLPEIKQDSVIKVLRGRMVDLKARKIEMISIYRDKHPKRLEIDSSIKQLELEIADEVQRVKKSVKAELDRAVAFEKSIEKQLDEHKKLTMSLHRKSIDYGVLQREAESNQNIYEKLLQEVGEVGLISNTNRNNISITYAAELPVSPLPSKRKTNILLAIVLGLGCGVGLVFFFEFIDNTVRTSEDVTKRLGIPMLGMVPYDKSLEGGTETTFLQEVSRIEDTTIVGDDSSGVQDYYYGGDVSTGLVHRLPLMQPGMLGQVIMVESSTSGEGKSTILARTAIKLARGGLSVVVVDGDLQHPSMHNIFGLDGTGEHGLATAMANVLGCQIDEGTLDKYSVADLFYLIGLRKQSGRLLIKSDTQTITAVFDKGCLFYLQSHDVPVARLGTTLLKGGFITDSQLEDALDRNKRTGQPLGYILLNAGFVNQEQLKGPLKLQMEEGLQRLFSWKHGNFSFESGGIEDYEDKRIRFAEDYTQTINQLSHMGGSRFVEKEVLLSITSLDEPNLSVLPAGERNLSSVDLRQTTLLAKFLEVLKQRYNVVLVDAPPILETMNAIQPVLSLVDGVIFVIKAGQVSFKNVNEAVNCIKESQTSIIGTVLNEVKAGLR